ncbi:hypothetical protein, partial [Frankia sp. Cr2]|uniref:hypothetical protein n=1 Tax=Frankia sp. Cr2 TaxID=3073932 RepID=UPI002AD1D926
VRSRFMSAVDDRSRAHALVGDLLGESDQFSERAVAVLNAHAAALAWVRDTIGVYPAPAGIAAELNNVAGRLRSGADDRDPVAVLGRAAVEARRALLRLVEDDVPRVRLRSLPVFDGPDDLSERVDE